MHLQHGQGGVEEFKPRVADRVRVDFEATLAFNGMPSRPVFIRDFSSRGFKCSCAEPLPIGTAVTLRVPNIGQFSGTIVWQVGAHAGARFFSPLPLTTVLSIVMAVVQEECLKPELDAPIGDHR